jgi:hypothetical protein
LVFKKNKQTFFRRKLAKFAENCDVNIDLRPENTSRCDGQATAFSRSKIINFAVNILFLIYRCGQIWETARHRWLRDTHESCCGSNSSTRWHQTCVLTPCNFFVYRLHFTFYLGLVMNECSCLRVLKMHCLLFAI